MAITLIVVLQILSSSLNFPANNQEYYNNVVPNKAPIEWIGVDDAGA